MTVAVECILTSEVGLRYAAICVVDNLANGLGGVAHDRRVSGRRRGGPRPRLIADLDACPYPSWCSRERRPG